jgi:hypothetical protein
LTPERTDSARIPLWVKLAYSGFMLVLVPYYWMTYGPTNFLYFCDVALFMALVAVWTERSLWASAPAVGIMIPQTLWIVDFLCGLVAKPPIGVTAYMFDSERSFFVRGLSLFHFWLPLFLLWLIARLGYDRRAFWTWTAIASAIMPICYFLLPGPPPSLENPNAPVNVNYVYGFSDEEPQTWMPPLAWLALLMIAQPLVVFLPTHLVLKRVYRRASSHHGFALPKPQSPIP